jgi:hypothetical protein
MTDYIPDLPDQPGSRARSREIGYADAMLRMYWELADRARLWAAEEIRAAEDGLMGPAIMFGFLREEAKRLSDYAEGMWRLHADDRPPTDPQSMAAVDMRHKPRHETGSFPAVQ